MVGVAGLEPATSRTPCVRASQLRHTPTLFGELKIAGSAVKVQYLVLSVLGIDELAVLL